MDHVELPLTQGKFAIIDSKDIDIINQYTWHAHNDGFNWYAKTGKTIDGKWKCLSMHRILLNITDPLIKIDHINGNGLDNRRINLRTCTHLDNMKNQGPRKGSSKYKGVSWSVTKKVWIAQIQIKGKKIYLGQYKDEKEAARAFNKASIKYCGEFAYVNSL